MWDWFFEINLISQCINLSHSGLLQTSVVITSANVVGQLEEFI